LNEVEDVIQGEGRYTILNHEVYRDRMYRDVMEEHDRKYPYLALCKYIDENWILTENPNEVAVGGLGVVLPSDPLTDPNRYGINIKIQCKILPGDHHLPHMKAYDTREFYIPMNVSLCVGYKKNLANIVNSNSSRWLLPLNDSHFNPLDNQDLPPSDLRRSRWHFTIYYCETSKCWKIRRAPDTESIVYEGVESIRLKRSETDKTFVCENSEVLTKDSLITCGRHKIQIVKIRDPPN
jgi:hypothetical protein